MPSFANLVLADGQATPVNHTFVPTSLVENLAVYTDRAKSIKGEQPYATLKLVAGKSATSVSRVVGTVAIPLYDAVNGKQVNVTRVNFEVIVPGTSTQAQRDDAAAYLKNLATHSIVQTMVKGPEGVY